RTGETGGIQKALEELNAAYSAAGASLYQQGQAGGDAGATPGGAADAPSAEKKEDVVEADYEIVDDGKPKS
ncbi:MAG TPA: molecular chaperone DnaK, partial [Gemmatimonadales bacterium]|nr:molecular chaperone DnaK [Gemmatimonadales bacterium]